MPPTTPYLFASYSLKDRATVIPFIEQLKGLGVNIYYDADLRPGEDWAHALAVALDGAAGVLVFVSPRSMQSVWVQKEIAIGVGSPARLVIPVILEHTPDLPPVLQSRQWVDLSTGDPKLAADRIAKAYQRIPHAATGASGPTEDVKKDAEVIAADLRREQEPLPATSPPDSLFIVHGHDSALLDEVEQYVVGLGIRPVVLTKIRGASQSLFQKFFQFAQEARFAIVLFSADDLGASRRQFEATGVADRALQFRARQNVILELGFFYGRLGWENVFVLHKDADRIHPNFERPSDLDGVIFDPVDSAGEWKQLLLGRLSKAGFRFMKSK